MGIKQGFENKTFITDTKVCKSARLLNLSMLKILELKRFKNTRYSPNWFKNKDYFNVFPKATDLS